MNTHTNLKERLSYGGFFVGQNIIYILVIQYLMLFYTDTVGLPVALVGTLFLVTKVWDAINDPIMGVIVDRVHFKGGKFKPWINFSGIMLPVVTFLMFLDPGNTTVVKVGYAFLTYILWDTMYTISDIPIFALSTAMTDNVQERVRILSIGRLAAGLAALIASVLTMPLVTKMGWGKAVCLLCFISLIVMLPIRFFAKERFKVADEKSSEVGFKQMFQALLRNKYLLTFYAAFFFSSVFAVGGAVSSYFAIYALGNKNLISVLALCGVLPALVIPIVLPGLINKFGKRNILLVSSGSYVAFCILYYFVGYSSLPVVFLFTALNGMMMQVPRMMAGMVTSDCVEYGAYTTGQRIEGIAFAMQTFANKLSGAFASSVASFMLAYIGYVPNVEQSEQTIRGIWNMVTLIPPIGYAFMFLIILFFYKLSDAEVQSMTNENNQKMRKEGV